MATSLWNIVTGARLTTLVERSVVDIDLPITDSVNTSLELISGIIPSGTRLEGTKIVGVVLEVAYDTTFTSVIRASNGSDFDDITLEIVVTGPDNPIWQTNPGLLPVGSNNSLFILDSDLIDFQLEATDSDLSAGDTLTYFIASGDGTLPPGITLTEDGRIYGVVEPLLSLDKRYEGGGYDTTPFGELPLDYAVLSSNGYGSFYYDTETFDFNFPTSNVRKLNRYYPFAVTVTDGDTFSRREFKIYLVGDDFLTSDNTIMQSSTNVFKADNTNVRTPVWITPSDLGFKRANNYTTLYLDVIDNWTLEGILRYTLEDVNDDNSPSELPPGLELDRYTGEIVGRIPYQPAITENYKFTVRATRITSDINTATIFANYYEDTLNNKSSFKIYKIDLTGNLDGVNDLFDLIGRNILLGTREYTVTNVDGRNANYDIIFIDQPLVANINLIATRTAKSGQSYVFVNRLSESQKIKYANRVLKFGESETYTINTITPYIEYLVTQTTPSNDEIYPTGSPRDILVIDNYFIGDYIVNTISSGGDGKIYKCVVTHNTQPQLDEFGNLILVNDVIQINFVSENWLEVAETLEELSLEDRITATKQALESAYGGTTYIDILENNIWRIRIPSTSLSRIITNIREFFAPNTDSTQVKVELIRDNEDKIVFDKNLSRQLTQNNNLGIALFKNEGFSKNIIVSAVDSVEIPSSKKTFDLRVIGEIDSNIKWITPADLGTINANFTSTLRVIAETTVPDTKMLYSIKSGKLPFGMILNYDGEIIGTANQFADSESLGLTIFDNRTVGFDGVVPGATTFDREYQVVIEARDRFNFTAIERKFTLRVEDLDNIQYTDIYMRPMLKADERNYYSNFISNPDIFEPNKIYRASDPKFGIQRNLDMLVYAGIEATKIENFVAASAKNHKRKKYILGDIKSAVAKNVGTSDEVYELVYIDVIDPANATKGQTRSKFLINNNTKITVDSIQYAAIDDETRTGIGYDVLPIYGRGIVKFIFAENNRIIVETRDNNVILDTDNNDFDVLIRDNGDISVQLQLGDSEPQRLRPVTNTIKADSNAIKASTAKDQIRYISSMNNMRDNIKAIGKNERNFLPLWMRTSQEGLQELDYQTAIPICYCKPGFATDIIRNITNSGFDPKNINYDIDRYILRKTEESNIESYILFANYQFNV